MASRLAQECPDTQIVIVADSEADIYDIFVDAQERKSGAEFLIRAKVNRAIPEKDPAAGPAAYRKVKDEARASEIRIRKTIELPQTPKRTARLATLEIRALPVTVKPPHARSRLPLVTDKAFYGLGGCGLSTDDVVTPVRVGKRDFEFLVNLTTPWIPLTSDGYPSSMRVGRITASRSPSQARRVELASSPIGVTTKHRF